MLLFPRSLVLDLNITLPTGTIVEVWKGAKEGLSFLDELKRVIKTLYRMISTKLK